MARQVAKYLFEFPDEPSAEGVYQAELEIPLRRILSVDVPDRLGGPMPVVWALIDTEWPATKQKLSIYETGAPVESADNAYVGTIRYRDVTWHVFHDNYYRRG